jgi:hypothetical protein
MQVALNPNSIADYETFLRIKQLPAYSFRGRLATFPDEYASSIGVTTPHKASGVFTHLAGLFDYQRDIVSLAIKKRKFAIFADCGLGKTLMLLEFARAAHDACRGGVLIVAPLMTVEQTVGEAKRFYGDSLPIEIVKAKDLAAWLLTCNGKIGITNYDAMHEGLPQGQLAALILDESSMLKSHYGKWGQACLNLGRGLEWKLCCTGTPAPNDRIEYANHAVFLDAFPTVNSFLATYFINRGQTDNRWELKAHALRPFYRSLSHWCIFLTNPATYGWKDNCESIPPINVTIHEVPLTQEQKALVQQHVGGLFVTSMGGITTRAKLGQIAKGAVGGVEIETNKPAFIKDLIGSFGSASTILWSIYNQEQETLAKLLPDAANISGATPIERRHELIADFKSGSRKVLISKPKILGFGLNLQIATKQVFNGLKDSYEEYYQAVKRSNRYGSTEPLEVHIPITEIEEPMVANVLRKAKRVQQDCDEQEAIFKESSMEWN